MMIEHQEIQTRSGKRIVFCKLEDLITKFYNVKNLSDTLQYVKNGEYIIHCPFCKEEGHKKHKLYIKEDLSVGNCFVCGRAYVNVDENVNTEYKVPDFLKNTWGEKFQVVPIPDESPWNLAQFHTEFDDYSERGLNYLRGRHRFMEQLWEPLQFKFVNDNVVMPFIYHGEVIYYQIRFIDATSKDDIRYFFPPMPSGTKPPYIIENGNNKKFIIVEGVYDAIAALIQAPDYTPMAVLGSTITPYQISFLREYMPEKILIWMDETEISLRIRDLLAPVFNYCKISIIPSTGADPEEIMQMKIRRGLNLQWITPEYGDGPRRILPKFTLENLYV